jgi:phage terminase large subunit-like protein
VVTVGIDGGGLDDLLGLAVIGRDRQTREWLCWCHAWAHTIALERRKSEISKLKDFERAGDLTIVKRVGEDVEQVAEYVSRIYEAELLDKIGIDPSEVGQILDALSEAGIPEVRDGVSQGWKLGGAIKTTERKLAEGVLLHGGQPLMAWCVEMQGLSLKATPFSLPNRPAGRGKLIH